MNKCEQSKSGEHSVAVFAHEDGTTRTKCLHCDEELGTVTCSGSQWQDPCSHKGVEILPARPCFWDRHREAEWFKTYIFNQRAAGGFVSPETRLFPYSW